MRQVRKARDGSRKQTLPVRSAAKAAKPGDQSPKKNGARDRPYELRISRLTVDKLGVKLYDKASAVVAELIANGYDADAEKVTVLLPLGVPLATHVGGQIRDRSYSIVVEDDGHGMTPDEAIDFFLRVGADRRERANGGARSRHKGRPVMGRKGIGKLAPFGICRRIEVWSAGGPKTRKGYAITHFFMDFDQIVKDVDEPVTLKKGSDDREWSQKSGTRIRLTSFLAKRVPDEETFLRQLAVRFTFARPDFSIFVIDTTTEREPIKVNPLAIPLLDNSRIELADRPVIADDGTQLPVSGWLGMAKEAYKNEEMMGVRLYARGKIVGVTRDFNQPAGFTGEFATRSYLVGQVEAEWLDLDEGDDLVRTDRQDILWDSEYGQLLRNWGADLIREIGRISKEPRRVRVREEFMKRSNIQERAKEKYGDRDVARVAVELAKKFGGFAAEDELKDDDYVADLSEIILSVAPHQALMEAFHELAAQADRGDASLQQLTDIFDKVRIAELASYAQIASQRVRVIKELQEIIEKSLDEREFQALLARAEWLIEPSWTVITKNQGLKSFKQAFEHFWKQKTGETVTLAIGYLDKRPDFTLVSIGGTLHIVEIKRANHKFDDNDFERLNNYVDAFEEFFADNPVIAQEFPKGWRIDLVADGENLKKSSNKKAYQKIQDDEHLSRIGWRDFLARTQKVHEQFLDAHDAALEKLGAGRVT